MKRSRLLLVFWITILVLPSIHVTRTPTKIALILVGTEDVEKVRVETQIQSQAITNILEKYAYQVHVWNESHQFHLLQADRLIFIYLGHGQNRTDAVVYVGETEYNLAWFSKEYFMASEEIFLTDACFSGSWLQLGRPGRLIITAINNTTTFRLPGGFKTALGVDGATANLLILADEEDLTFEEAFPIWKHEIILPWYGIILQTRYNTTNWHPCLYDGIDSEVWL